MASGFVRDAKLAHNDRNFEGSGHPMKGDRRVRRKRRAILVVA